MERSLIVLLLVTGLAIVPLIAIGLPEWVPFLLWCSLFIRHAGSLLLNFSDQFLLQSNRF
jgi:hypothetical protein